MRRRAAGGGGFAGFGGGQRMRMRPMARTQLRISFEDAIKGGSRRLDLGALGVPGGKTVEVQIPPGEEQRVL